uniref:Zinc finger PMZ-type domain-containing protein n=1 Tax=Lactuca sativa TaxID=4236 RepID=A0A9R1W4Z0_LACSA|nr:hypothetical protein LSAT_V11C300112480 [Lactuca sativa]
MRMMMMVVDIIMAVGVVSLMMIMIVKMVNFFIYEDNLIHDVDVDMKDFHMNIDKDVEWVGGSSKSNVPKDTQEGDLEVINIDVMLSGSSLDEENDGKRRKIIRSIQRVYENDATLVSDPFYIFQTFISSKAFKTQVKLHSIRTRTGNTIATLFPCIEHRYCLHHIYKNMKKIWGWGEEFKDLLWECATTSNLNNDPYEWLKQIPLQSWARSHSIGRANYDALTHSLCEAFNSKLKEGRDAPIITSTEFIREYIMKKIVKVEKEIKKVVGPLTPTTTKILDKIKSQQSFTCKRWELTGIPCKHGVDAIWYMARNNKDVGIPESFVHPCHWLSRWKEMYSFKISPINGRSMWEKLAMLTTLLPQKHCVPIGRPKKKRTISTVEKEDNVRGNTTSRAYRSVTCNKCKTISHNARTYKGKIPTVGGGGG